MLFKDAERIRPLSGGRGRTRTSFERHARPDRRLASATAGNSAEPAPKGSRPLRPHLTLLPPWWGVNESLWNCETYWRKGRIMRIKSLLRSLRGHFHITVRPRIRASFASDRPSRATGLQKRPPEERTGDGVSAADGGGPCLRSKHPPRRDVLWGEAKNLSGGSSAPTRRAS